MSRTVLLILIGITLLALFGCSNIERKREIESLRNELAIARDQGADPEVIARLEARIEDIEDEEAQAPIIDTGNPLVNQGLEWLIALAAGYLGIRYWRGSPTNRKGAPPTNGS